MGLVAQGHVILKLSGSDIEPGAPSIESGFLTMGPPRKSPTLIVLYSSCQVWLKQAPTLPLLR